MKINWGTSITISIILFMSFILFFVIKMSINDKYSHDLVAEEYYKKELEFQDEINKEKNLQLLKRPIEVIVKKEGLTIEFPNDLVANDINGTVFLYRPSNKKLDIEIPLSISSNILFLPKKDLVSGRWNIIIDFTHQGTAYLVKKEIML
ncbi:MAG: FixH family protein [Flavobacteriaceae bacterium]|nr:FixH family protein [Flavobacteriaceae bacterium]